MDLRRWPDADRLIEDALALDPPARAAFVRRAAGTDTELGAALQAVIDEADPADGFLAPGGALDGALAADLARADAADTPPLEPGTRLAEYEILELAGRGGMGEVYRARDVRLGRLVALKILPERFAADAERLARFHREARVLASLHHPRIGGIHGIVEDGRRHALVLEWVEGPTLADRLAAGRLPTSEALTLAIEIAQALEAAHQRAVVHRDLKPGNIKLTRDGAVVLDFGLAKAAAPRESSDLPSVTTLHERPGLVLGTPAYMSPEQARGQRADHRADIWAFGCVLVEMLTGRRAFAASSTDAILERVLEGTPDTRRLPGDVPPAVRTLIGRLLDKDPRRRLGWIGEALVVLEDAVRPPEPATGATGARARWWHRAWPALGGLALGLLAAWLITPMFDPQASPPVNHLAVPVPGGDELVAGDLPTVAVSRDGRRIVYRARRAGTTQLFHRALDRAEPEPIPNSEHAIAPFLSPDGRWVAFSRDGALVKVPIEGGTPVTLCATNGAVAGTWATEDAIVFGGELTAGLLRVDGSGGTPERFTSLDAARRELAHGLPEPIDGAPYLAFTIWLADRTDIAVVSLDGRQRHVLGEGRQARLVAPTHLAFIRQNALWTAPFDTGRLVLTGSAEPVPEAVDTSAISGVAHFAVSPTGTLVYLPRRTSRSRERLVVWTDRAGREQSAMAPGPYTRAAVSPDGAHIALAASGPESRDLWLHATDRGTLTRITFDEAVDTAPVWTPDGRSLVFRSDRDGGGLFLVRADGAGSPRRVTRTTDTIHTPYDVTRDGRHVVFTEFRTYRDQAIGMAPLDGSGKVSWLVDGPFAELRPRLSPDGRWVAYQSDESGRFEVYVRPFPEVGGGRWQISTAGGVSPAWGPGGRELFFYNDGHVVSVPVDATDTFRAGVPVRLFALDLPGDRLGPTFDISPDGQRFLFVRVPESDTPGGGTLRLVEHWPEHLKRRTPR